VTAVDPARITWETNLERRYPYGPISPDPDRFEPIGFPPPWPARPWIYANFVVSRNEIVAWKRQDPQDDPVRAIAGGDFSRPGRRADVQLMRYLRACADAVSVGAQTLRDQPRLTMTLDEPGGGVGDALSRFRERHGMRRQPLQILYTQSGALDLGARIFNTPGLEALVVTTGAGARHLRSLGSEEKGITLLVTGAETLDSATLVGAHARLSSEFGVRYLACEGGATMLESLHLAGIVDELFVTETEVVIEPAEHEAVKRLFGLEGARLIAEGRTASDAGYVFRRWRFNER
jgi:riboflavin biosynthesis pyrimidine reductase